jgi:hypothetical protein
MKDQALSVLSAIATEKAELLSGGATSRVEIIAAPAVDEWSDVVDGVVIESSPVSTGNTGRRARQKARHLRLRPWLIAQTVNNRLPLSVPTLLTRMVCQFLSR